MEGVLGFTKIGLTKPTVLAACRIYYERGAGFGEHFLVAKKVSNFQTSLEDNMDLTERIKLGKQARKVPFEEIGQVAEVAKGDNDLITWDVWGTWGATAVVKFLNYFTDTLFHHPTREAIQDEPSQQDFDICVKYRPG